MIDSGKSFDWGRTSADYAQFRDIYPEKFYRKITERNLCVKGQKVLDMGTGTGVLPRNMYIYGAEWTAADISENQIHQAEMLSADMNINYCVSAAENLDFPDNSFDVVTACQCFWYFDHENVMSKLYKMLKPAGKLLVLYMAWLPYEDDIAGKSEALVLKYSPAWSGARETMHPIQIPNCYKQKFDLIHHEEYPLTVHFSRDSWHGRMKACRGVGASLSEKELQSWEAEHLKMLAETVLEEFDIKHYVALAELQVRK